MPRTWQARLRALVIAVLLLASCSNRPPDEPKDYAAKIAADRAAKDAAFAPRQRSDPAEPERRVPAARLLPHRSRLQRAGGAQADRRSRRSIEMPTSTGGDRQVAARRHAGVHAQGPAAEAARVQRRRAPIPDRLFVAFSDLTSGTETYAAGRFLDLDRNGTGIYEVDFNRAYIPYCYYNPTYECPYPPAENRLRFRFARGEKTDEVEVSAKLRLIRTRHASRDRLRLRRRHRQQRAAAFSSASATCSPRQASSLTEAGLLRPLPRLRRCRARSRRSGATSGGAWTRQDIARIRGAQGGAARGARARRVGPVPRRRRRDPPRGRGDADRDRIRRARRRDPPRARSRKPDRVLFGDRRGRRHAAAASRRPIRICARWHCWRPRRRAIAATAASASPSRIRAGA